MALVTSVTSMTPPPYPANLGCDVVIPAIESPVRIGILLSGRGSNAEALIQAHQAGQLPHSEIVLVLSNVADATGLTMAAQHGIPTRCITPRDYPSRDAADAAMTEVLQAADVSLVVLAGYNRILSAPLLDAFPNAILNIHPSLLPAYGGKGMVGQAVHTAVLTGAETFSGCTVHGVTAEVDAGPLLGQAVVPVLSNDTPETLGARVLTQEHRLYTATLNAWVARAVAPHLDTPLDLPPWPYLTEPNLST